MCVPRAHRPEEVFGFHGTRVTNGCELSCAGNKTWVLCKSNHCSKLLSWLSSLKARALDVNQMVPQVSPPEF